jgi:LAS superfamily LD-carboxypeptidase LdcB
MSRYVRSMLSSALTIVDFPGVVAGQTPGGPHVDHVYMEPRAASALLSMLRTYRDMTGMYLDVIEGYRPYANQEYWWEKYAHDARFAAVPGTSVHGWGKAVDFTDELLTDNKVAWLHAYGPDFNYHPISTERWHFNYVAPSPDLAIGMDPEG